MTTLQKLESCLRRIEQRNATRLEKEPFFIGASSIASIPELKREMEEKAAELQLKLSQHRGYKIERRFRYLKVTHNTTNTLFYVYWDPSGNNYVYFVKEHWYYNLFSNSDEVIDVLKTGNPVHVRAYDVTIQNIMNSITAG